MATAGSGEVASFDDVWQEGIVVGVALPVLADR